MQSMWRDINDRILDKVGRLRRVGFLISPVCVANVLISFERQACVSRVSKKDTKKPCVHCRLQWETCNSDAPGCILVHSSRLARLISKCSLKIDFVLGVVYFQWSIPFMTRWGGQLVYSSRDAFSSGLASKGLRMGRRNVRESLDLLTNMAWSWKSLLLRIFHRTPVHPSSDHQTRLY